MRKNATIKNASNGSIITGKIVNEKGLTIEVSLSNTDYLVVSSVYVVGNIIARKLDEINKEKQDV